MNDKNNYFLIMRHAHSTISFDLNDFERPLSEKGLKQAASQGKKLEDLGITIHKALVSSALRTKQTFEGLFKHSAALPKVLFLDELYNATPDQILACILQNALAYENILLIAHMPGVYDLSFHLEGNGHLFSPADLVVLKSKSLDFEGKITKPNQFVCKNIISYE